MRKAYSIGIIFFLLLSGFIMIVNPCLANRNNDMKPVSGNLIPIWNKTWGGTFWDEAQSMTILGTDLYIAGYTNSSGTYNYNTFLLKYDKNGNLLWNKTWGGTNGDQAFSIVVDSSNIYISGYTKSYGAHCYDAFVLKTDLNGGGPPVPEPSPAPLVMILVILLVAIAGRRRHT